MKSVCWYLEHDFVQEFCSFLWYERLQTAICCLEWLGRLKGLATGLDVFLLSFSTTRRCSRNGSPCQGSKLKKSLGRFLATNWRNIVARCKFSVTSLYNQNNFQVPLVESVWYRLAWRGTHSYNEYFLTYPFLFNNVTLFIYCCGTQLACFAKNRDLPGF